MKIDTEAKARAYFDIHNQALLVAQNDPARYPCTHFHVGFTPYAE